MFIVSITLASSPHPPTLLVVQMQSVLQHRHKTIVEEVAKKAAETEVTAGTVAEEMAENVTEKVAETEIVTMM